MEAHFLCNAPSQQGLNPIKLAHNPTSAGQLAQLTASIFDEVDQYASRPPVNILYCIILVAGLV